MSFSAVGAGGGGGQVGAWGQGAGLWRRWLAFPTLLSLFWLSRSEVGAGAAEVAALVPLLGSLLVVAVRRSGIKMGRPILFLQAGGSSLIKF